MHHPPLGSASTETRHELGTDIIVEDGHLKVRSSAGELEFAVVAVYSPGNWASAEVERVVAAPATATAEEQ